MGRIIISENISLDGVIEDPTGDEGSASGGWFNEIGQDTRDAWGKILFEEVQHTEALLLGRRSYDWFFTRWASRTGDWADRLNGLPKYVVSSTLENPEWNAQLLTGDVEVSVAHLRQTIDGDIAVFGSGQLAHTLIEHDLVDEYRLMVYPCALGAGARLFAASSRAKALHLIDARVVGDGLAYLTYQPVRTA
jgi:dihydrofolate reductase